MIDATPSQPPTTTPDIGRTVFAAKLHMLSRVGSVTVKRTFGLYSSVTVLAAQIV
jgi:hypothetical protein